MQSYIKIYFVNLVFLIIFYYKIFLNLKKYLIQLNIMIQKVIMINFVKIIRKMKLDVLYVHFMLI